LIAVLPMQVIPGEHVPVQPPPVQTLGHVDGWFTPFKSHVWRVLMSEQDVDPGEHMPTHEAAPWFVTQAWLVQPVV